MLRGKNVTYFEDLTGDHSSFADMSSNVVDVIDDVCNDDIGSDCDQKSTNDNENHQADEIDAGLKTNVIFLHTINM
ncbi:hypothetical protein KIN20_013311 [Parelaphostrongylus tenuis]|uniref:Uncharacterized protein n=1 Tax=Parelaphostrongylus tenuis TaxID=148309 RepID=A0AAD5MBX6_PARTN|nr:hypothetical protein KIN20_013311 [Parelaphostrongylus tenuis]